MLQTTARAAQHSRLTKSHNMKRLTFLFALFILCLTARAQNTYITAIVTVTNCAVQGDTFSINGHQRMWTNVVTSANNQIQNTNGSSANAATNLFLAYITYPETSPYISVTMTASNVLVFQTLPGPGPALTIATNGLAGATNWVTWSISTTPLTNAQVIRLPTNGIGNVERTNDQNWFVGLFDDVGATNAFFYGAPMFREFLSTNFGTTLSNNLVAYASNTVVTASNHIITFTTNLVSVTSNSVLNFSTNYSLTVGLANTNFTLFASNYLYSLLPAPGSFAPWQQDAGGGVWNVYLTNNENVLRMEAEDGGGVIGTGFEFYESDGSTVWFQNDSGGSTSIHDREGITRLDIQDVADGTTNTVLLSGSALGLNIRGNSGVTSHDMPIVIASNIWPCVAGGTVTNWVGQAQNTNTSVDGLDLITIPANALTNNGDRVVRTVGVKFGVDSTSTKQVSLVFGSTTIIDSGAQLPTDQGGYVIRCEVTRIDASTIAFSCCGTGIAVPNTTFGLVNTGNSGINYGSTMNFVVNVQSTGTGSAASQITIVSDNTVFYPSAKWQSIP